MDTCISADAQTITYRVCEFISETKIDIFKMRGIGTDGASTMIGCNNGMVTHLKRLAPSAIYICCAAHRLNLASSQAGDSIAYVKNI